MIDIAWYCNLEQKMILGSTLRCSSPFHQCDWLLVYVMMGAHKVERLAVHGSGDWWGGLWPLKFNNSMAVTKRWTSESQLPSLRGCEALGRSSSSCTPWTSPCSVGPSWPERMDDMSDRCTRIGICHCRGFTWCDPGSSPDNSPGKWQCQIVKLINSPGINSCQWTLDEPNVDVWSSAT